MWIKDGKVLATPRLEYATADNITRAACGQEVGFRMIPKLTDSSVPLFTNGNGGDGSSAVFQSTIATGNNEYAVQSVQFGKQTGRNILMAVNVPPGYLLYEAYKMHIAPALTGTEGSGIYIELTGSVKDSITGKRPARSAFADIVAYDKAVDNYMKNIALSYCLMMPATIEEKEARTMMGLHANQYLLYRYGIAGRIEKRPKTYLLLEKVAGGDISRLKSKGGRSLTDFSRNEAYVVVNTPFSILSTSPVLSHLLPDAIFEDRTGLAGTGLYIDLRFPKDLKGDIGQANALLKRYGLRLRTEVRPANVLVIAKRKTDSPS